MHYLHYFKERKVKIKKVVYLFNSTDVKVPLMLANQPTDISDKLEVLPSQQKRGRSKQAWLGNAGLIRDQRCQTDPNAGILLPD